MKKRNEKQSKKEERSTSNDENDLHLSCYPNWRTHTNLTINTRRLRRTHKEMVLIISFYLLPFVYQLTSSFVFLSFDYLPLPMRMLVKPMQKI
jgi:hypothetical protein